MFGPFRMAEVAGDAAERHDEVIVLEAAVGHDDGARLEIDRLHLAEFAADVLIRAEDGAQRLGDLHRGQRAGGYLVQQRLEEVMILPVDECNLRLGVAQRLGHVQAGKAAPENDDAGVGLVDRFIARNFGRAGGGRRKDFGRGHRATLHAPRIDGKRD
jgi:hypothetical protein